MTEDADQHSDNGTNNEDGSNWKDRITMGGDDLQQWPQSTGSSSTQPSAKGGDSKKKVVINYADHVRMQMEMHLSGGPVSETDQISERSRSNISIGYNHEPTSPMRHRSSTNAVAGLLDPNFGPLLGGEVPRGGQALFQEELEAPDAMAFESKNVVENRNGEEKFGKEEDNDSLVSGHSLSRLQKKSNLEIVWQKANSISGIRRLNMMFKEERRSVKALDEEELITAEYMQVCDTFLQMIELKQNENLKMLTQKVEQRERIFENIKSEINKHQHMCIGLGRRMPVPQDLNVHQAVKLQRQIMDRLI